MGDGLSFEIFDLIEFLQPVIFCIAFDQYAIQALKANSIGYLLKPIERDDLEKALIKFDQLSQPKTSNITPKILDEIVSTLKKKKHNERFLVKVGLHLRVVEIKDILYFYCFQNGTYMKLVDGKDYLLDYSLEVVEEMIDLSVFFRINRKYLVALKSITDVVS